MDMFDTEQTINLPDFLKSHLHQHFSSESSYHSKTKNINKQVDATQVLKLAQHKT